MRTSSRIWLFLALLLALGIRFYQLGFPPLNDDEARLALQAWKVAQGLRSSLDSQVLYVHSTAALFFVFGPYDFLARFWPALTGSLLVLLPWALRHKIGERVALLFAFLLALDPGMVALSRQANAWMPVLFSLGMAWITWEQGRQAQTGIFLALALLGGRPFWEGLLFLLIGMLLQRLLNVKFPLLPFDRAKDLSHALLSFLSTLVIGGTLFFLSPAGFGATWNAPLELIQTWTKPQAPLTQMFLVLIGYELLPLLLTLGFLVIQNGEEKWKIFTGVTFALPLLLSGHTPNSWMWFLVCTLFLAARALDLFLEKSLPLTWSTGLSSLVSILLLGFVAINLIGIAANPTHPINAQPIQLYGILPLPPLRFLVVLGAFFVLSASLLLIGLEWGGQTASQALFTGVVLLLGTYTLGSTWSVTALRFPDGVELWSTAQSPSQAKLLEQTVSDLSLWHSGHRFGEKIVLAGWTEPPASLVWLLRRHPLAFSQTIQLDGNSTLLITPAMKVDAFPVPYRGQDFLWQRSPSWEMGTTDILQWLFFRHLPLKQEMLILWARNDIFEYK